MGAKTGRPRRLTATDPTHAMTDFLHMGGYGWFVWGSYGVAAAALALELFALRQRRRQALRQARDTEGSSS